MAKSCPGANMAKRRSRLVITSKSCMPSAAGSSCQGEHLPVGRVEQVRFGFNLVTVADAVPIAVSNGDIRPVDVHLVGCGEPVVIEVVRRQGAQLRFLPRV